MVLKEGRYISHVWFINSAERDKDWMCWVWRDPGEAWQVEYRFRYYKDDKAHDSADEKSGWAAAIAADAPEEMVVRSIDILAAMTKKLFMGTLWKVPIENDHPEVAFTLLRKQPWFFMQIGEPPS